MKKYLLLPIFLFSFSLGFASFHGELPPIDKAVAITDLDFEKLHQFYSEKTSTFALACKEGTKLPLKYLGKWGAFLVKFSPNIEIALDKDCYLRVFKKKMYLSYDFKDWIEMSKIFSKKVNMNFNVENEKGVLFESTLLD